MSAVLGLDVGCGPAACVDVVLAEGRRVRRGSRAAGTSATRTNSFRAGAPGVTPWALVGTSIAVGLVVALFATGASGSPVIGLAFAAISARGPFALVAARAAKRQASMRDVWPEAVDHLASGIRAGLSLPEALSQLGERGPEQLREPFTAFAEDFRATGRFGDCLDALKARLADPVADRIVEALRITRDVGGTDVGRLLRTLSQFLRDDARTRGELEASQSWTVNAARLAVTAPWLVLALLATGPRTPPHTTRPPASACSSSAARAPCLRTGSWCASAACLKRAGC